MTRNSVYTNFIKDTVRVGVRCPFCGEVSELQLSHESYKRWITERPLVQDCFPELNYKMREMLISGICPKCWDKTFETESEQQEN